MVSVGDYRYDGVLGRWGRGSAGDHDKCWGHWVSAGVYDECSGHWGSARDYDKCWDMLGIVMSVRDIREYLVH